MIVENELISEFPGLDAEVLRIGHHGSNGATSRRFLEAVAPEVAIISVGRNNPYGHPHTRVLKDLREAGAVILRTDRDGAITLTTDGWQIYIQTER